MQLGFKFKPPDMLCVWV